MFLCIAGLVLTWSPCESATVFPAPAGLNPSTRYQVWVDSKKSFVYDAQIPDPLNCAFTSFDFTDSAQIRIVVPGGFSNFTLRPLQQPFQPHVHGDTISFKVRKVGTIALTLNGNFNNPLFIFANPPEVNPPKPGDPGVLYYGPGVHNIGTVTLEEGQTAYLAGGAVLRGGGFIAGQVPNATIRGRGIMDRTNAEMEAIWSASDGMKVEGIIIANQPTMIGHAVFGNIQGLVIENTKLVSGDHWSNDGFYLMGCSNVLFKNIFVKNYDDGITIKAHDYFSDPISNIRLETGFFWTHWAHSIAIGAEVSTEYARDMSFKDVDVVMLANEYDANGYTGAIGIFQSDSAEISQVTFEDFRVENYSPNHRLVNIQVNKGTWSTDNRIGSVHDITLKNIQLLRDGGQGFENLIQGYDASHPIESIHFINFNILGNTVQSASEGNFTITHANDVTFSIENPTIFRRHITSPGIRKIKHRFDLLGRH